MAMKLLFSRIMEERKLEIVTDVVCAIKTVAGDLLRALPNFEI